MTRKMILITAAGLAGLMTTAAMAQEENANSQRKAPVDRMFERADLNGDDIITAAERDNVRAEMFATLDTDANGFVTAEEFEAHREAMRERFAERRAEWAEKRAEAGRDGERLTERRAPRARFARHRAERHDPMERLDTNGDDMVSQAEFMAGDDHKHFEKVDTNGDGDITRAEAEAAHDKMRARMMQRRGERKAERETQTDD